MEQIRAYVDRYHMLEQSDIVITGISGGADSVCLLFVLLELQKEIGFGIRAVHVHHGIRGEDADRDAEYVRQLTEELHVPCSIYCYDVESEAKKRKQSTEEAGREVRREAFFREMQLYHGTKIALAHHEDDNAETFLMNLSRGSRLQGLGGIRPVSGAMIRPLLCVRRKEIEDYLQRRGIGYCTDATNFENVYMRNKIRNCVIPYLEKEINPETVTHINGAMEQLRQIGEYMESQAEDAFRKYVRVEDGVLIEIEAKQELPEVIFDMVCHRAIAHAAGSEKDITRKHVKLLGEMWEQQEGNRLSLPYHLTGIRKRGGIRIGDAGSGKNDADREILQEEFEIRPGIRIEAENLFLTAKLIEKSAFDYRNVPDNIYTKWFDYDIIKDTVTARKRRPGDYITIDETGRRQKLKSYLINEKIPREERDQLWLIAQGSHVLWVAGYRRGCAAHVSEQTKKILEITIHGGEKDGRNN